MNAFIKTLVGDVWNVSTVVVIVLAAVALIDFGHAELAAFVIPPVTLAGVGWLARH
jgi:hypothetical protein